jgi:uncharacterized damage-inducible protein DinB
VTTKDALRTGLEMSLGMVRRLTADLSDEDLLVRPTPGANCIAWQLGHLVGSDCRWAAKLGVTPDLPPGFTGRFTKEAAAVDPPSGLPKKAELLSAFETSRAALKMALDRLPESELDRKTEGPMAALAPTTGALFLLMTIHASMHAGQFSAVRRKLGKPVLF